MMEISDYDFILEDRKAKIQAINSQYDLENNAYISFSGGKDSRVLSHLIDLSLPGNKIPRVYVNTGIEYVDMVKFVKEQAKKDSRIIIINNTLNIKKTLAERGYPFKSKEYSAKINIFYNNQDSVLEMVDEISKKSLPEINKEFEEKYHKKRGVFIALNLCNLSYHKKKKEVFEVGAFYSLPQCLRYQFTPQLNKLGFKISDKCCLEFKEKPMINYQKESGRYIAITGVMHEEGGRRHNAPCTAFDGKTGKLKKFHPLSVISKKWETEFIERERDLSYVNYIIHLLTLKEQVVKDVRLVCN